MQNYCKTIGALAAASALVAGNALAGTSAPVAPSSAPESGIQYELHAGYTSEYLFRGDILGQDLVETGFDIAGEWNGIGLSAGAWYGSFQRAGSSLDELDLYTEASYDFGFVTGAIGYIFYHNVNQRGPGGPFGPAGTLVLDDAQELYFSLSRDFGFAEASLTYFWDIESDNCGYSELALTRSFELSSCLALNVGTNLGYQAEEGQCTAWTTKVGLDWAFAESAKLSPFVALSIALSDDNDSVYTFRSGNEIVAGSMISVSF